MGVSSRILRFLIPLASLVQRLPGGQGAVDGGALVFLFHRVTRIDPEGLHANEDLKVSPEFLERFVLLLRAEGYRIVSMDELAGVIAEGKSTKGLSALTFDDGYQDNLEVALPIFRRLKAHFTVYVTVSMTDGNDFLWWFALETFLKERQMARFADGREMSTRTPTERNQVFMTIRACLLREGGVDAKGYLLGLLPGFKTALGAGTAKRYMMDWEAVRRLSASPFATVGCHTMTHANLRSLEEAEARRELIDSKDRIEREIGRPVRHLAFPYGDSPEAGNREYKLAAELGFTTAVTSLPGNLGKDAGKMLHRIPRVFVREGKEVRQLIAENRARVWLRTMRGLVRQ
jgi:peptidoglycan/xylan/chitin deacetylase (PgdA/CDA1 family)